MQVKINQGKYIIQTGLFVQNKRKINLVCSTCIRLTCIMLLLQFSVNSHVYRHNYNYLQLPYYFDFAPFLCLSCCSSQSLCNAYCIDNGDIQTTKVRYIQTNFMEGSFVCQGRIVTLAKLLSQDDDVYRQCKQVFRPTV